MSERPRNWPYNPVIIVSLVGLAVTQLLFSELQRSQELRLKSEFEAGAQDRTRLLGEALQEDCGILGILSATPTFCGYRNAVRHFPIPSMGAEFQGPDESLRRHGDEIQAVAWLPQVTGAERADYEQVVQQGGKRDFQSKELDVQGGLVRASRRIEYFAVYPVLPLQANRAFLGLDVAAMPAFAQVMQRARDTNQPAATAQLRLPAMSAQESVVCFFRPVYSLPSEDVAARRANLIGFVAMFVHVGRMAEVMLQRLAPAGIPFTLYDESAPPVMRLLYHRRSRLESRMDSPESHGKLRCQETFSVAGRQWSAPGIASLEFAARRMKELPWIELLAGWLLTFLLAFHLYAQVRGKAALEQLVNQRTAELSQEVAAHKRDAAALRKSEEQYRQIFDNAVLGIFQATPEGRYLGANDALARMLGYASPEDLTTQVTDIQIQIYVQPSRRHELQRLLKKDGEVRNFEFEAFRKDGSKAWICANLRAVRGQDGKLLYYEGTNEDITERKRTEEALQESRAQLAGIVSSAMDGIITVDENQHIVLFNEAAEKMFQCPASEALGRSLERFLPQRFRQSHQEHVRAFASAPVKARPMGSRKGVSLAGLRTNGEEFAVEVSLSWTEVAGKRYSTAIVRDITERRQAEETLRKAEERYRDIFDNALVGIFQTTPDGRYLSANRALARTYGYSSPEELIARITDIQRQEYVQPSQHEQFKRLLMEHGQVRDFEVEMRSRDGSTIWIRMNARTVYDTAGKLLYYEGTTEDITEHKKIRAILQQSEEQLRQANEKLTVALREMEHRSRKASQLSEMAEMLQSCQSAEEAYRILASTMVYLFPATSGALCVTRASRNMVEAVAVWGASPPAEMSFAPEDCWALRRGRLHCTRDQNTPVGCRHANSCTLVRSMCVPLIAQEETLGILHLRGTAHSTVEKEPAGLGWSEEEKRLVVAVAEHLSLALANLKLREKLLSQSIRDPLTGLFNRRYMEETVERILHGAARKHRPVSLVMLDVDHFKHFNDTHGHEAGDVVLREVAAALQNNIRGEDVACRYGGEEFVLIMVESSAETAIQRAEQIREEVKRVVVQHHGRSLGAVTVSLGVAGFPEDAQTLDDLLRAADQALYRAKAQGRDRVMAAAQGAF